MSRRFCGLMLCGLSCLTAALSCNVSDADEYPSQQFDVAGPDHAGFDTTPQLPPPMMHNEGMGDPYLSHEVLSEPIGRRAYRGGELDITPPGTLGQTYTRVSHPVPLDKHPRTAMLAVKDDSTVPFLTVGIMGGVKMKNGIWLFESTRPLDPGACQIVRVEARQTPQDVEAYATRFVRLIPGRIVYLDF